MDECLSDADKAISQAVMVYLKGAGNRGRAHLLASVGVVMTNALVGCAVGLRRFGVEESEAVLRALGVARQSERAFLLLESEKHVN